MNRNLTEGEFVYETTYIEVPDLVSIETTADSLAIVRFIDFETDPFSFLAMASVVSNNNSYAFKVSDGRSAVFYRGLVIGPLWIKQEPENFREIAFQLGLDQEPIGTGEMG